MTFIEIFEHIPERICNHMLEVSPHNSLNIVKMAIKFSLALEKMNFQTRASRMESSQIHRFKQ